MRWEFFSGISTSKFYKGFLKVFLKDPLIYCWPKDNMPRLNPFPLLGVVGVGGIVMGRQILPLATMSECFLV